MSQSSEESAVVEKPTFDSERKLVTSYLFSPLVLAAIRLLLALFSLITAIYTLVWQAVDLKSADGYFSYFTNLTWIGLCAYFWASGVQSFFYSRSVKRGEVPASYPLQRWHKVPQYLQVLLYSTIVTYPILVTIVYWVLLASSSSFSNSNTAFSNITKHALNSVFALFEIFCTNVGPLPWWDLPVTILILGGYLGVAYITYETQGFYPYSFLDPKEQGGMLAAYIVGIAAGHAVVFCIVWGIIKLRETLVLKSGKKEGES